MATALRRAGLPVAIQSESDLKGDNPAYAWLTALCTIMVDPRNAYEIVGVLREVFGIADHDLAIFSEGFGNRFRIDSEFSATGVVSSPLRLLAETRRQMEGRALFDAVKILVEQTQLRQKLASLPREDFADLEAELDTLLALTAEAEARGVTLAEFAEKLRLDFLLQRDVRRSTDDGIQLITAQKAKGSEWQAVILPFLGRNVTSPSPRYPCVIKIPGSNDSLVALTKDDFPDEVRSATKTAVQQEMARLLYVATTRARHTLVLALDEEIFARSNGELQNGAQLKCLLGEKQINRPHFDILGAEPSACPETAKVAEQSAFSPETETHSSHRGSTAKKSSWPKNARRVSCASSTRAVTTKKSSEHRRTKQTRIRSRFPLPARPRIRPPHCMAVGGINLFNRFHGITTQSRGMRFFAATHANSPDMARSAREWKLLRERISKRRGFSCGIRERHDHCPSRDAVLLANGRTQMLGRNCRSCVVRSGEEEMVDSRLENEPYHGRKDRHLARAISSRRSRLIGKPSRK